MLVFGVWTYWGGGGGAPKIRWGGGGWCRGMMDNQTGNDKWSNGIQTTA